MKNNTIQINKINYNFYNIKELKDFILKSNLKEIELIINNRTYYGNKNEIISFLELENYLEKENEVKDKLINIEEYIKEIKNNTLILKIILTILSIVLVFLITRLSFNLSPIMYIITDLLGILYSCIYLKEFKKNLEFYNNSKLNILNELKIIKNSINKIKNNSVQKKEFVVLNKSKGSKKVLIKK